MVRLASRDGTEQRYILIKSGVLPGDHTGPRIFNRVMHRTCSTIVGNHYQQEIYKDLYKMKSFLFPDAVRMGLTSFVDDLGHKAVGFNVQQLLLSKTKLDSIVETEMGRTGISMNSDKEVNVLDGPRAAELNILRTTIPHHTHDARYLGGRHTEGQGSHIEVGYRLNAMRKSWYALKALWTSDTDIDFLSIIYKCCVVGAAVSGMESCTGFVRPIEKKQTLPRSRHS